MNFENYCKRQGITSEDYMEEIRPVWEAASQAKTVSIFKEQWDVMRFQQKFRIPMAAAPSFLDRPTTEFRVEFMEEELNEFKIGYDEQDLHQCADALVDLAYVLHGTALMMGLPWPMLWNEVHRANMSKERAKPDGSNSKRGSALDVVKPAGWRGPDHAEALGAGPWPTLEVPK